jgi:hypothetical protein
VSLSRSDVVQLLTLWFAVLIFLQTGTDGSNVALTVVSLFAIALMWLVPLYIVVGIAPDLRAR